MTWLIDVMKYVIRHDHFEALQFEMTVAPCHDMKSRRQFQEAKSNFINRGVLSLSLFSYIWAPLQLSTSAFEKLLEIMEQFEIIVRLDVAVLPPAPIGS
jgi:hypothetical protein